MSEDKEKLNRVVEFEDFLGRSIKDARERRGLSQRAAVELLRENGMSIDASGLARIEKRDGTKPRSISFGEAVILSSVLGVNLTYVIERSEPLEQRFLSASHLFERDMERLRSAAKSLAWRSILLLAILQEDEEFAAKFDLQADSEIEDAFRLLAGFTKKWRGSATNSAWDPIAMYAHEEFQAGLDQLTMAVISDMFIEKSESPEEDVNGEH